MFFSQTPRNPAKPQGSGVERRVCINQHTGKANNFLGEADRRALNAAEVSPNAARARLSQPASGAVAIDRCPHPSTFSSRLSLGIAGDAEALATADQPLRRRGCGGVGTDGHGLQAGHNPAGLGLGRLLSRWIGGRVRRRIRRRIGGWVCGRVRRRRRGTRLQEGRQDETRAWIANANPAKRRVIHRAREGDARTGIQVSNALGCEVGTAVDPLEATELSTLGCGLGQFDRSRSGSLRTGGSGLIGGGGQGRDHAGK